MATVYQKTPADKCIILSPRQALLREMNIPTGWTDLMICIGGSFCHVSGDNAAPAQEDKTYYSPLDHFFFGIKDSSHIQPVAVGSRFIGNTHGTYGTVQRLWTNTVPHSVEGDNGGYWNRGLVADGLTTYSTGGNSTAANFYTSNNDTLDTGYFGWNAIRITREASATKLYGLSVPNKTDASDGAMASDVFNASGWTLYGTSALDTRAWDIRSIYIRLPFVNNRLRVHNYGFRLLA